MADASGSYDPESVFIAGEERIRTQLGRILHHPEPTVGELDRIGRDFTSFEKSFSGESSSPSQFLTLFKVSPRAIGLSDMFCSPIHEL